VINDYVTTGIKPLVVYNNKTKNRPINKIIELILDGKQTKTIYFGKKVYVCTRVSISPDIFQHSNIINESIKIKQL